MAAKYKEFSGLNLPAFEQEILAKWTEHQAFEKKYVPEGGRYTLCFL